jgi:hypothetical protein
VPSDTDLPHWAWSPRAGATGSCGSLVKLTEAGFAKLAVCLLTAFLAFWLTPHDGSRTRVQTWLRLAGQHVPAIYGPSGDVSWDEADSTFSVESAKRGGKEHETGPPSGSSASLSYFTAPGNRTSFSNEAMAPSASSSP